MSEIVVEEQIGASPEVVFAALTDYSKLADVLSAVVAFELLTDGPLGKGTRFRETRMMFGREATEEMEITEWDPPNGFVLEADNHGAHYRTAHTIQTSGDGSLLTFTFGATGANLFAKIMCVVMGPLMKKTLVRCIQQDLAELKQHLEAQA